MTIEIVNATSGHKELILAACEQTFADHQRRQPFAFPKNSFEVLIKPDIQQAFRNDSGLPLKTSPTMYVALIDGEFAGYVRLSRWSDQKPLPIPYTNIEDIYVAATYRQSGVGSALISKIKSIAATNDWGSVTASVWAGNDASFALFSKHGFTVQSTTMRYGPDRQAVDYPIPTKPKFWQRPSMLVWLTMINAGLIIFSALN